MKRCPECRRDYTDETLNYCLDDGTALVDGPASMEESPTAILHSTAPPMEAATQAQIHLTDQTSVIPQAPDSIPKRQRAFSARSVIPLLEFSATNIAKAFRMAGITSFQKSRFGRNLQR